MTENPLALSMGGGLLLKGFTNHPGGSMSVSFKQPVAKGKRGYHLACYLGVFIDDDPGVLGLGTDERLNAMGWVFDPERAEVEYAKALAERGITEKGAG